ncbi:hypothetical protein DCAR_0101585 [Daucus carota subsp. sativus]|uniref:Uncharacterized protein n=1 Tax=Daucus carota subsp. sativus TaxID=79200 RepID=A0AAF0W5C7_DAUCS|nr:hypothetical protein DCAR_0101585 [Daucus carota subsp. sativus]
MNSISPIHGTCKTLNASISSPTTLLAVIDTYIVRGSDNYSNSYISRSVCGESESKGSNISTSTNGSIIIESSNDLDITQKYRHLWVQCENCYGLNYKKISIFMISYSIHVLFAIILCVS